MIKFPKDFLWGTAASAYQVEGGNVNSDWWEWEKRAGLKDVSGQVCRHYEFYENDFDLAKSLNHNCHRLSIEWSRVEPEEGKFSQEAIDHYVKVVAALKERGIEPVVTLHHFTNPIWFSKLGGWAHKDAPGYFSRYAQHVVSTLCDKVRFWVTINEPSVYAYYSYIAGLWPPQEKSFLKAGKVMGAFNTAHIRTYRLIHEIYKRRNLPRPMVSIAHHVRSFVPRDASLKNRFASYLKDRLLNHMFIKKLVRARTLDFLGINYYTRDVIDARSWNINSLLFDLYKEESENVKKNYLGWDIYPEGLFQCLVSLRKYKLPVFIIENGICTQDDNQRWDFIREHLKAVGAAIESGVRVMGYLYWSLIDNFEWTDGFGPRFGIIEIDYNTCKRIVRESAKKFAQVCRTGILEG